MKKITLVILFTITLFIANAQTAKEQLYDKLHSPSFAWLTATMVDNFTTINMTEQAWKQAATDENYGINILNTLGNNIAYYFETLNNNRFSSECRYGQDNDECKSQVEALKGRLSIVFNAESMKFTAERYKLAIRSLQMVAKFFDNGNYGPKVGWRPQGNSLKIILNIDNGRGLPTVTWSSDGSTATIKMPVEAELSYWDETIFKGLQKGGKK